MTTTLHLSLLLLVTPGQAEAPPADEEVPTADTTGLDAEHEATTGERPQGEVSVYVMDPKLVGLPSEVGAGISDAIAQAATEQGLTVMTQADAKTILAQAIELSQLGADDSGVALAALGRAVGAKHLITTSVTAEGDDSVIFMRLVESQKSKVLVRRETRASEFDGELLKAVQAATRLTLAPMFEHLKGKITLDISEEDANVLLDGEQLGVSPIDTFIATGGFHLLTVTKEGFIRHQETIRIEGEDVVQRMIRLRPSMEYMQEYRDRNSTYRIIAWVSTVLAVGGLGAGGALFGLKSGQDAETRKIIDDYEALKVSDPVAATTTFDSHEANRVASIDKANKLGEGAVGAIIGGGAMTLVALYFWIFGEDPDRYEEFEQPAATN